jgi:hypothetical protein
MSAEGSYGGPERRAAPRYKVNFHARWGGEEWGGREGAVGDLSTDGCFVLTDNLPGEGELVRVELELPGEGVLTLWGHVVYGLKETGFASSSSAGACSGLRTCRLTSTRLQPRPASESSVP